LCWLGAVAAGCACRSAELAPGPAAPAAPKLSAKDEALLDKVVAEEWLDADRRALMQAQPGSTENGYRHYVFELKAQPGMAPERHYDSIVVSFAPPGSFVEVAAREPKLSNTAGPNGSVLEAALRTSDGRFDVRVSEAALLPDTVELTAFDVAGAAQALSRSYERQVAQLSHQE
jgi:hypothetical protein